MIIIEKLKKSWPIFLSLLWEFWLPTSLTFATWLYSVYCKNPKSTAEIIGIFSMYGFWAAQWNRVSRQRKVDSNLTGIESKAEKLLNDLDEKTLNLVNHITGGDSFCVAEILATENGGFVWMFKNHGKFPLHGVVAQFANIRPGDEVVTYTMNVGTLSAGATQFLFRHESAFDVLPAVGDYQIFFSASNGIWVQDIKWITKEKQILTTVKVETPKPVSKVLYSKKDPGYSD